MVRNMKGIPRDGNHERIHHSLEETMRSSKRGILGRR